MPFVNEVVSDDDIDRYNLPFAKGGGQWWTRDQERDLYLWGGRSGNPARDEEVTGRFKLFIDGHLLRVVLGIGTWSKDWSSRPYIISWGQPLSIDPSDFLKKNRHRVVGILKEALVTYGKDGWNNRNVPERIVVFDF